jgi:hypothetical protein
MSDDDHLSSSLGARQFGTDIQRMQSAMSDPDLVRQVQEQFLRYQPSMKRVQELVAARDIVTMVCVREIACYLCDLCARLETEYDPAIGQLLLQHVGKLMAQAPARWEEYTRDIAPGCNASKLRTAQARGV